MKVKQYIFFCWALLAALVSCKKDKPPERPEEHVTLGETGGVFVINEGNFMFGNAKVSYYNKTEGTVIADLYSQTNGLGIGDVLQSMVVHNSKAYLVVNNSSKIEVCDPVTLQRTATITGVLSPRYFLPVSNSKAYVTDIYADKVWIVNLSANTVSGFIPLPGWGEQLTEVYGKVYITNMERGKVYVIDALTDQLTDSITVSEGAGSIHQDANGKLWVLCSGNSTTPVAPALYRINPLTNAVEQSFALTGSPSMLCANSAADSLYFLNSGVYCMPIASGSVPVSPVIAQAAGNNFYGLGVDPATSRVYVADALDYIQTGNVFIYRPNGALVSQFQAAVIPSGFWFQ